jgi:hypothetical protein
MLRAISIGLLCSFASDLLFADGLAVDKVYHPYVQPLERELEYRVSLLDDGDIARDGIQLHRVGAGLSINERWFAEVYLIGAKEKGGSLSLDAYEAELKWQLTEQGEYAADWGLLFELEVNKENSARELATTVLVEKEFGRWTGALNIAAIYEWGSRISNEIESSLASQLRYRLRPAFEPALELYANDFTKGLGPVALGTVAFSEGKKLRWEAGLIFGLDNDSPDQTLRLLLEYEF